MTPSDCNQFYCPILWLFYKQNTTYLIWKGNVEVYKVTWSFHFSNNLFKYLQEQLIVFA